MRPELEKIAIFKRVEENSRKERNSPDDTGRPAAITANKREVAEYFQYLRGRQTRHGDSEPINPSATLTCYGTAIMKQDHHTPWTFGEAEKAADLPDWYWNPSHDWTVELPCHDIKVNHWREMMDSDLPRFEETDPPRGGAYDAVHLLVLMHARAGVDITHPAYVEGLETAIRRIKERTY
jgi:hypothetical protein